MVIWFWLFLLAIFGTHVQCLENNLDERNENNVDDVDDFIVGGRSAASAQFPFIASIQMRKKLPKFKAVQEGRQYSDLKPHCGGAIISAQYILTAGHCFDYQLPTTEFFVKVGTIHANSSTAQEHKVESRVVHPDYQKIGDRHDLAILRLAGQIKFSPVVSAIALGETNYVPTGKGMVMGWGLAGHHDNIISNVVTLQFGIVDFWPVQECIDSWANAENQVSRIVTLNDLCAINKKAATTSCKGDSGGPIVTRMGAKYYVVGVTSFGATPCGSRTDLPTVYTRVTVLEYFNWIHDNTQ